jgi:hypothetical protein
MVVFAINTEPLLRYLSLIVEQIYGAVRRYRMGKNGSCNNGQNHLY